MMATLLGAVRLALGAISRSKLRSALTVLGIFIGITAVVLVTALTSSASALVSGEIDSFAANVLWVFPQAAQASGVRTKGIGRLTEADGLAISTEAVSVASVAPFLMAQGQVVSGDKNWST